VAGPTPTSVDGADAVLAGRWQLGPLLGRGGMADVHRGQDLVGGGAVAVKVLRVPEPTLARRLAQEAQALRRVSHPGLVRVLDAGSTPDGRAYLVMELVEGISLAQRLAAGPLSATETARLGTRVAGALAAVHAAGVVHRDVKPGNLLVARDGQVKLADFGIASLADVSSLTVTGTTLGTAAYMAPEQLQHHQVGPAADVWSLGLVLLECLLGRRLYQGSPAEVVAKRLAGPVPLPEDLPAPWRTLLAAMLAENPAGRPSAARCAEQLADPGLRVPWQPASSVAPATVPLAAPASPTAALAPTALADGAAPPAPTLSATALGASVLVPPGGPTRRRRRRALAGAGAGLLAVGVLAFLLSAGGGTARPIEHHHRAAPQRAATPTSSGSASGSASSTPKAPSPQAAAAALLAAVGGDVADGGLSSDQAAKIGRDVSAALIDTADGSLDSAASDLTGIEQIIAKATDQGSLSAAQAASLEQDLATLAAALGLPAPSAPAETQQTSGTSSSTATAGPGGPGPSQPPGPAGGGPGGGGPPGHQPGH
jgi:hypothetical protein